MAESILYCQLKPPETYPHPEGTKNTFLVVLKSNGANCYVPVSFIRVHCADWHESWRDISEFSELSSA